VDDNEDWKCFYTYHIGDVRKKIDMVDWLYFCICRSEVTPLDDVTISLDLIDQN